MFPFQNDSSVQQLEITLPRPTDSVHLQKTVEPAIKKARHNQSTDDAFKVDIATRLPNLANNGLVGSNSLIKIHDIEEPSVMLAINTIGSNASLAENPTGGTSTQANTTKMRQMQTISKDETSLQPSVDFSGVNVNTDSQRRRANQNRKFS